MKFRKKPAIIEAEQFRADTSEQTRSLVRGVCYMACLGNGYLKPHVHTIHNNQAVILEDGDWVIPEPDGVHYYPCKDHIFKNTYEPVT